ncbi:MAG: amino acid--tRNA ligase-related protein, partial [Mycobacteriales bacterium]
GVRREALELLGAARLEIGRRCELIDEMAWNLLFVVDFPMFAPTDDGGWTAEHHPFCSPTPESLDSFDVDPENALADAYDMVCNGWEIMSGSIRIHRPELQRRVFNAIGLSKEDADAKFGFLLDAFAYGPPPHGGAALGWDRIVALLAGADSIREVIAFPKVASGGDPLTGAPTQIPTSQRKEAGIDAKPQSSADRS